MPTRLASLDSLVHPHQMEIQEFSFYALVIDARSAASFAEDHLPGAVSVPVGGLSAGMSEQASSAWAVREAPIGLPYALLAHVQQLATGDPVLVYCDRGGLDSLVWAEPLRAMGFEVDVLGGGWPNYRRWVAAGLELLPRVLSFKRLCAPPVSGLCEVLATLATMGEQVLDLAHLAGQRLVPGMSLDLDERPSQAAFDSGLLDKLRRFDPRRPVWVREGSEDLGGLALAPAMREALDRAPCLRLEVPLHERARAWFEYLQATGTNIKELIRSVLAASSKTRSSGLRNWQAMLDRGQGVEVLSAVIARRIDPAVGAGSTTAKVDQIELASLKTEDLARELDRRQGPSV